MCPAFFCGVLLVDSGYGWRISRNNVILYCHAGNLLGYPASVDTGYFAGQNSGMTFRQKMTWKSYVVDSG